MARLKRYFVPDQARRDTGVGPMQVIEFILPHAKFRSEVGLSGTFPRLVSSL